MSEKSEKAIEEREARTRGEPPPKPEKPKKEEPPSEPEGGAGAEA